MSNVNHSLSSSTEKSTVFIMGDGIPTTAGQTIEKVGLLETEVEDDKNKQYPVTTKISKYFSWRTNFIVAIAIIAILVVIVCVLALGRPPTSPNSSTITPTTTQTTTTTKQSPSPFPTSRPITRGSLLDPIISLKYLDNRVAIFNISSLQLGDGQGNYQVTESTRNFAYYFNVHGTVDSTVNTIDSKCVNVPACQLLFGSSVSTATWYAIGSLANQPSLIDSSNPSKGLKITYGTSLTERIAIITIHCLTKDAVFKTISVAETIIQQYDFDMYHEAGCPINLG
ncbi:hypothetical protein HK098_007731 [Nowakowskiella sp. JEL0407]|nr:hypothetical protein HK098_007731 [Nowakowskiella sp. JEL0407]